MPAMITVRLSADLHEKFRSLAYAHEISMNELAIRLIQDAVQNAEAKGLAHRLARAKVADDLSDSVSRSLEGALS